MAQYNRVLLGTSFDPKSRPSSGHCIRTQSTILRPLVIRQQPYTLSIYRMSQEEWTKLRESVPYVELYQYNPKNLYPKLNGYGDNGQRKVWTSCISAYCTSTAVAH